MSTRNPYPNVRSSVEFITPEAARDLLGSNVEHQRKIAPTNLGKIESDLINDRFRLNGEPIIIGESGKLLDGQHRLCACQNTKIGFWSVVVRGVDDECFYIINIGKSRSLPDVLKIAGEKNCNNLAATLSRIVEYLRDARSVGLGGASVKPVSAAEAFDVLRMMPKVRDSVAANCFIFSGEVISCGRIAWLHCLAHEECPDRAPEFFEKLQTGEMLTASDPIYHFRARMIAEKHSKAKLRTREILALLVKTWNAYLDGTKVKTLRWSMNEEFPVLKFK
jgi:hypothetical protein